MAAAHTNCSKVEVVYRRGHLFQKRIALMEGGLPRISRNEVQRSILSRQERHYRVLS